MINNLSPIPQKPFVPPVPQSVEATGLDLSFLSDLALKILYFRPISAEYPS